jgi:hypothetical protein
MRNLMLLISFLLYSLIASSQIVIDSNNTYIKLSYSTASKIKKDLLAGDSAKAQLILSKDSIKSLNSNIDFKDSLIRVFTSKNEKFSKQILLYKETEHKSIQYSKDLKESLRKQKFRTHTLQAVGLVVAFAGMLILFTTVK